MKTSKRYYIGKTDTATNTDKYWSGEEWVDNIKDAKKWKKEVNCVDTLFLMFNIIDINPDKLGIEFYTAYED
ncbi:MAG: hypothetical protein WC783_00240 [Candidatus Paceibacterota bacterium]|jgi:hypothetical protein